MDWHNRFLRQADWTKPLRDFLFSRVKVNPDSHVLDLGCGTGVISADFYHSFPSYLSGIDLDFDRLSIATRNSPEISFQQADAFDLPFSNNTFDIIFCHYLLLWIDSPEFCLSEVLRVMKPGASFLILAEPDHAGRVDSPEEFTILGNLQTESLVKQGVNIKVGRQLPTLLSNAGFSAIQVGVSGFQQSAGQIPDWWESEWLVLKNDLKNEIEPSVLAQYENIDRESWLNGSRVLWVPTFYALCSKPDEIVKN